MATPKIVDEAVWENLALSLIEQAERTAFSDVDLARGLTVAIETLQARCEEASADAAREDDDDPDAPVESFSEDEEEADVKELDFG